MPTLDMITTDILPHLDKITFSEIADQFEFQLEIQSDKLDDILLWCKSEVEGDWRWQLLETSGSTTPGRYHFYFEQAKDCCAFSLKWA
jgi:hypothetical protein